MAIPLKVKRLSELAPAVREHFGHMVHPCQFGDNLQLVLFVKPVFEKVDGIIVVKATRLLAEGATWPEVFDKARAFITQSAVDLSGEHVEI